MLGSVRLPPSQGEYPGARQGTFDPHPVQTACKTPTRLSVSQVSRSRSPPNGNIGPDTALTTRGTVGACQRSAREKNVVVGADVGDFIVGVQVMLHSQGACPFHNAQPKVFYGIPLKPPVSHPELARYEASLRPRELGLLATCASFKEMYCLQR